MKHINVFQKCVSGFQSFLLRAMIHFFLLILADVYSNAQCIFSVRVEIVSVVNQLCSSTQIMLCALYVCALWIMYIRKNE